jgi:putative flippase GtrA
MKKIKIIVAYADKKIDLKKFFKFGVTGIINTAVDFAVFSLCLEILKFNIKLAQPIGQAVAIISSYIINKNWTFNKRKNYNAKEILKFLLVNGCSISINILGVYIFYDIVGINEYLCKIPIAFVTVIINYFGNKLFVFRPDS